MNVFKRKKIVYVLYDYQRQVFTIRLDSSGDGYESDDMEMVGYEYGDKMTDSDIASLVRKLKEKKLEVILQKI